MDRYIPTRLLHLTILCRSCSGPNVWKGSWLATVPFFFFFFKLFCCSCKIQKEKSNTLPSPTKYLFGKILPVFFFLRSSCIFTHLCLHMLNLLIICQGLLLFFFFFEELRNVLSHKWIVSPSQDLTVEFLGFSVVLTELQRQLVFLGISPLWVTCNSNIDHDKVLSTICLSAYVLHKKLWPSLQFVSLLASIWKNSSKHHITG